MIETGIDWWMFLAEPRPQRLLNVFREIHEKADADGIFLRDSHCAGPA